MKKRIAKGIIKSYALDSPFRYHKHQFDKATRQLRKARLRRDMSSK